MAESDPNDPLYLYGSPERIARILYIFTAAILVCLFIGAFILLTHLDNQQAYIVLAAIPAVVATFFLIARKKYEPAAIFLALVLFFLITVISTSGLGIHHISNIGFTAVMIVASMVIHRRTLVLLNLIAILCLGWLVFGDVWGLYTPTRPDHSVPGDFFTSALIVLLTSVMVRLLTRTVFQTSMELRRELGERKRAEARLAHDTLHDGLTDLPNRTLFLDRLGQRLERAKRYPEDLFAVMVLDLDRFKVINDSLGHLVGDMLLIATSQRLVQCLRPEDTVSRLSGDEFAILLADFKETSDVIRVADRIHDLLTSTPLIENINRTTTASLGITIYNRGYSQGQEMLRDADSAMYRAKAMGSGQSVIFDETMYANAIKLINMEADLKHGVEHNEWRVFYQPIVAMPNRNIVGVEALVRWQHPQRGLCMPSDFIQVAEETGVIIQIGEFVMREACWQLKTWRAERHPTLWMSINLSARQFQDHLLVERIQRIVTETGLPPGSLHMEITETVAMKDIAYSTRILEEISNLGVLISLDDFGNGYSSLGYLKRFPLKVLKIDRSFIADQETNQNNQAITSAIISLGHTLNLEVIAEGIETEKQWDFLESASCDNIQGYLFSRPVPASDLEKLM